MKPQIQNFRSLIEEMKNVASGKRRPRRRASKKVFQSEKAAADAVMRLMTTENQKLITVIANGKVGSVAELADATHRAQSNVARTLKKLQNLGLVTMSYGPGRKKIPHLLVRSIQVKVDLENGKTEIVGQEAAPQVPMSLVARETSRQRARER